MTKPDSKVKFDPMTGAINIGMTFEEFKKACPEIARHMRPLPSQADKTYKLSEIRVYKPIHFDMDVYDVVGRAEEVSRLEIDLDDLPVFAVEDDDG